VLSSKLWIRAGASVVTLKAGSITGLPISPGYGGHQQQDTQQPFTALRPQSATPPRLQIITLQFMLIRATTQKLRRIFLPRASLPSTKRRLLTKQQRKHLLTIRRPPSITP
jgi:hypothetical protein